MSEPESLDIVHVTAGIVPIHGTYGGGVEKHIRSITSELSSRGHSVSIVDRTYDQEAPDSIDGVSVLRTDVRRVQTGLLDGWADHVINEIAFAAKLGTFEEALAAADVVHAHNLYVGLRARRFARAHDAAFAYTCHNGMWCADDVNAYERHVVRRLEGSLLRDAELSIAVSNAVADGVRTIGDADPRVIPNGVDIDQYHPDNDDAVVVSEYGLDDCETVLFVGRLVEAKGVDVLLRAIPMILEARSDPVQFVFVGPEKHMFGGTGGTVYASRIQSILEELDLDEQVHFVGQIPDEDLEALYARSDVFVLPSRFEAQGMVLVEALASGTPVVGTTAGGIPEVVTDEVGRVVPIEDPGALANGVLEVLADADTMGAAARRYAVENYAWPRVVDELERAYLEVA